jgi:hypothetical protein
MNTYKYLSLFFIQTPIRLFLFTFLLSGRSKRPDVKLSCSSSAGTLYSLILNYIYFCKNDSSSDIPGPYDMLIVLWSVLTCFHSNISSLVFKERAPVNQQVVFVYFVPGDSFLVLLFEKLLLTSSVLCVWYSFKLAHHFSILYQRSLFECTIYHT